MRPLLTFLFFVSGALSAQALVINEVMSNPIGDDGGREWIEIYNNTDGVVDLSSLTISIKGGSLIPVTPVSGGLTISPRGYAVIGSVVSGSTKFALDYPAYTGPLFKSSISLVNTGVTSIELRLQGAVADSLPSYTAAKEGSTYSFIDGSFVTGMPTPGEENKAASSVLPPDATSTDPVGTQITIAQMSPPTADIVFYLPNEKLVVAGAPSVFSVYSLTRGSKPIDNMIYNWSFGDGGARSGSTTIYRYFYPGRYIAQVEGTNGLVAGVGRVIVKVVSPDIEMSTIRMGKYGSYVTITNPNRYDLDLSLWKLSIDGSLFTFPKNTLLLEGETRFSGMAMGFASTTISSSTLVRLLFQNMDEVIRVYQEGTPTKQDELLARKEVTLSVPSSTIVQTVVKSRPSFISKNSVTTLYTTKATTSIATSSSKIATNSKKDTRVASFLRSLLAW